MDLSQIGCEHLNWKDLSQCCVQERAMNPVPIRAFRHNSFLAAVQYSLLHKQSNSIFSVKELCN
jgi:hypothetical protein